MSIQTYEKYWSITNAFTDYNGKRFLNTLQICIDFIDKYKNESYSEVKYGRLQQILMDKLKITDISVRKAINQLLKLGFLNSGLKSYHADSIQYINLKTSNKKRQSLLSKIVYSNSSLNRSVTNDSDQHQINFLIKTLIENSPLTKEDIIALMLVDISSITKGFLTRKELDEYVSEAKRIKFIERKYNQIDHLCNLLGKLDELRFVEDELYFEEDAKRIFGDESKSEVRKRDPYLHRVYKNQLEEESMELYDKPVCMLEKVDYPVLIASHIKPFINSSEYEAYDPNNGLLLSRTVDSLFDLNYISFNDDGTIIFANELSDEVKNAWKEYKLDPIVLTPERLKYLEYHRNHMRK